MMRRGTFLFIFVVLLGLVIGSESILAASKGATKAPDDAGKAGKTSEIPSKPSSSPPSLQQQADELQVKTNAMMAMTELLTDRRARCRKRVAMMTAYLKSIGKLEDYEQSNTEIPAQKGEMTFRQACNQAVKHAKEQGGHCVDPVDTEEIRLLKRIYNANKRLARKAWKEFVALRTQTRSMGAYLNSIGKVDEYKKWAGVEKEKQAAAHAKAMQAEQQKDISAYKKRQAQKRNKREQVAAQMRQDRQETLRRRFELRQQELYNRMREQTAAPEYNVWGGWGDSYDDVHRPRRYYR